ncbi:MAG: O-antigen ligase family protein [Thermoanaerobaculia bacterium]
MAKKKRPTVVARAAPDLGAVVAAAALAAVLAGTALAVDTAAGAAFDAPKRLIALAGTALAAAAAFAVGGRASAPARPWREGPALRRAAFVLGAAALFAALLSALASPRRAISLDAMRAVALLALILPLGASRIAARGRAWLAGVFLAASAINAFVAVLESRDVFRPFALEIVGWRQDTGAYAGNVGYLAITLALASVLALGVVLEARRPLVRFLAGAALPLYALALVVNQNLTALTALLAGAAVLLVLRFRARAALPVAAAVAAVLIAVAAYPPLSNRARELSAAVRTRNWDALVSFRGGPWATAVEMIRERPLSGFGPGTFAAEYVPHRLSAEIRARRRFVSPLITSSYAEAHSDYLQVFCDAGVPAGILALSAAGCLGAAIGAAAWRRRAPEAIVLAALLSTGAAAALTWFPLQRPVTAVPLLLAAGRAWKICGEPKPSGDRT